MVVNTVSHSTKEKKDMSGCVFIAWLVFSEAQLVWLFDCLCLILLFESQLSEIK